ncbi:MAG: cyclic nucleotide-binding domain-containing protein [Verrucomicrobiales bacterium]|nr:cyclic nucleotide-binding domain-containing protein [Verrucomicrobiales bacterium]
MREIPYNHESGNLPPTLASIPFLSRLDGSLLDDVLAHSAIIECDPGDTIISEGEISDFFVILLRGAVKITKSGETVAELDGSGQMIGELALLNDAARSATVTTTSPAFCLRVESGFINKLADADRNAFFAILYQFVAGILADRLTDCSTRLAKREEEIQQLKSGPSPDSGRFKL